MGFPDWYEKVVVFPDEECASSYENDERFVGFTRVHAKYGAGQIQGLRIKEIWVHWYSFEELKFSEMMYSIIQGFDFMPPGLIPEQRLFR